MDKQLILASGSIRRAEILDQVGIDYRIIPSNFDESTVIIADPIEYVKTLAFKKAESVARYNKNFDLILGADTSVVINGHILGKPHNKEKSREFLKMLSNRAHKVYTGVSLIRTWDNKTITRHQVTSVHMDSLSEDDIEFYISTKEPFDKAGGYGIQGIGARFVKEIHGDYFNVVGLPINLLIDMLKEMGEVYETITNK